MLPAANHRRAITAVLGFWTAIIAWTLALAWMPTIALLILTMVGMGLISWLIYVTAQEWPG